MSTPSTTVVLYRGIQWDNSYENTIYFPDRASQVNYFKALEYKRYTLQSYHRFDSGTIRIQETYENVMRCNYIWIVNSISELFAPGISCCFITKVNYINDNTTEIEYEIDVMQTFLPVLDYALEACYVEREHSLTDRVGEHTIPEDVMTGDIITYQQAKLNFSNEFKIVVAATFVRSEDGSYHDTGGAVYAGLYSGLNYTVFDVSVDGINALKDFIINAGAKSDGIVNVFLMPTIFIAENGSSVMPSYTTSIYDYANDPDAHGYLHRSDGSSIRNNKLRCYPYNYIEIRTPNGQSNIYKIEYFGVDPTTKRLNFKLYGEFSPSPSVYLVPMNYKGSSENYQCAMSLTDFPQIPFVTDTFRAWLAQNESKQILNSISTGIGSLLSAGAMAASGNALGVASAATNGVGSLVSQSLNMDIMSDRADQAKGSASGMLLSQNRLLDFYVYAKTMRQEYIDLVDDYFTAYGYSCKRIKVPNINARIFFTFTKTVGMNIYGNFPAKYKRKIESIFDSGIRFWNVVDGTAYIGNYDIPNLPHSS